ncbi:hypothetical protein [Pedobacter sp.]|jgi:hypothetical protein|uniref:hypothetical protein n=1 Tax=Pedobacter sp. TaxID=1411316 RepID=UPI002D0D72A2|nr:hypothetical protein [Pedobacter sp.]HWW40154.1 hypothetical protein [Pedobacter sp.]
MKQLLYFGALVILMTGCKKKQVEIDRSALNGAYKGKLYSIYQKEYNTYDTEVNFNGNNYNSRNSVETIGRNFGEANGTFDLSVGKRVKFSLDPSLVYTADFDWGTVLKGEYLCETKGDSLILIKNAEGENKLSYQYRLKRVN